MRFPVFARGANPSADRPILRKKLAYLEMQVASGRAYWVDSLEPKKGIIARELLYFGPPSLEEPERTIGWGGPTKFVVPDTVKAARAAARVLMVRPLLNPA